MSLSSDAPLEVLRDHIAPAALSNYVNKITTVCGMFLVCYEWVISLDREISVIWTGKMSFPKFLYINVRLGNIALLTWLVICYLPDKVSLTFCRVATEIEGFGGTMTFIPVRILMLRRVAALYNNSPIVIRSLSAALVLQVVGQYVVLIYTFYHVGWIYGVINEPIKGVAYQGCFHAKVAPKFWVYWLFPFLYDITLCVLIIAKGIRSYPQRLELSLLSVLVRDSILYYVAVGAAEMATLIVWSKANGVDDRMTAGTALGVIFEPILCCRLFLNTYDAISGAHYLPRTTAPATTRPTFIEMSSHRPELDSFGYPKLSTFLPEQEAAMNQDRVA